MTSKLTVAEANEFLATTFAGRDDCINVVEMDAGRSVAALDVGEVHRRPGGYVSGPTQMSMADMVAYMVVMTRRGVEPMAVTSNLNMHFLRPCIGERVIAEGRLLKMGRSLATIEVDVRVAGADVPASYAIVTYALPKD